MKKEKSKKIFPSIKKDILDFCLKEEGQVDKKMMAKLGLSLAMLAVVFEQSAFAGHSSSMIHSNAMVLSGLGGHASGPTSHASHGSHGSHAQW